MRVNSTSFVLNLRPRMLVAVMLCAASSLVAAHSGDLNSRYGTGGTATIAVHSGIVQNDQTVTFDHIGRTIFSLQTDEKDMIGVLSETGDIDTTFGKGGFIKTAAEIVDVKVDSKNRIVVLASTADTNLIQLSRYFQNGSLDKSFGSHGTTEIGGSEHVAPASIALDADDNIVWVGTDSPSLDAYIAAGRVHKNGTVDTAFGASGWTDIHLTSGDERAVGRAVAISATGEIFIDGYSALDPTPGLVVVNDLIKLAADGTIDTHFAHGAGYVQTDASVVSGTRYTFSNSLVIDAKGNLVVAGSAGNWLTFSEFFVARFTADGDFDSTFNSGLPQLIEPAGFEEAQAINVSIDSRGKLVLSGTMQPASDDPIEVAAFRLNNDGQQDMSFGDATGFAVVPDAYWGGYNAVNARGNILIVGNTEDQKSLKISELIGYDKPSPHP